MDSAVSLVAVILVFLFAGGVGYLVLRLAVATERIGYIMEACHAPEIAGYEAKIRGGRITPLSPHAAWSSDNDPTQG